MRVGTLLADSMEITEIPIYIDREDRAKESEAERVRFIKRVLDEIEIPGLDEVWPKDSVMDAKAKLLLRDFLTPFDLDIVEDIDGSTKIYNNNDVIAEWFPPRFILKRDLTAKRKSQMLYYEMIIRFWSY